jgi:hypothetical protein
MRAFSRLAALAALAVTAIPANTRTAANCLRQAVAESLAGKPVALAATQACGCSVKYAD